MSLGSKRKDLDNCGTIAEAISTQFVPLEQPVSIHALLVVADIS